MSALANWTRYIHHDSSERYLSNPLPGKMRLSKRRILKPMMGEYF